MTVATTTPTAAARLAEAALSVEAADMAPALADTVACALAGERAGGAGLEAVSRYAAAEPGSPEATVWATGERVPRRAAALRNAVAARVLDLNDTYISRAVVHPSDLWAMLVAECEAGGHGWDALFDAAATGYAVVCRAADGGALAAGGLEASSLLPVAAALAAARLKALDPERAAHAAALAALDAGTLRVARAGRLSHWKAISAGWGALKGAEAARLAAAGVNGPALAFEHDDGFLTRISGDFALDVAMVPRVLLKRFPVQIFVQLPVELALRLHGELAGEEVERVEVTTFAQALRMAGTRAHVGMSAETADHSIPFAVAVALLTGELAAGDLQRRLDDPRALALAERVEVTTEYRYESRYPRALPAALTVHTASGRALRAAAEQPDDRGLAEKLRALLGDGPHAWPFALAGAAPSFAGGSEG